MIQPLELLDKIAAFRTSTDCGRCCTATRWPARCGRRPHWISASTATWCFAGEVWRVAVGKLEQAAPAGGPSGKPARTRGPVTRRSACRAEAIHPVQGASRAERATASSSPPIVVIEDDGCIRARVPRSCHRPTPTQLPGPPGFPRPPRGVLAIVGYPRLGEQLPHSLEALPHVRGRDSTSSS